MMRYRYRLTQEPTGNLLMHYYEDSKWKCLRIPEGIAIKYTDVLSKYQRNRLLQGYQIRVKWLPDHGGIRCEI